MGWGWFSSSASAQTLEAPATAATATQNGNTPQASSREVLQSAQMKLMLLEKQNKELLAKLQKEEQARHITQTPGNGTSNQPLSTTLTQQQPPEPLYTPQQQFSRSAKQLSLFFAGATFLTASALISRRAVARRMIDAYPRFFEPSHYGPRPPPRGDKDKGEDTLVAVEALGLATLNVISFGVMMTGGMMFAFDISNLEDLRRKAKSKMYGTGNGVVDVEAEQQIAEWIADVMSKKDKKESSEPQTKDG